MYILLIQPKNAYESHYLKRKIRAHHNHKNAHFISPRPPKKKERPRTPKIKHQKYLEVQIFLWTPEFGNPEKKHERSL